MSHIQTIDVSPVSLGSATQYSQAFKPTLRSDKVSFQFRQASFLPATPIVTNVTLAIPAQVHCEEAHGLTTGQRVTMNAAGMSIDGNTYPITVIDSTRFNLDGTDTTLDSFSEADFTVPTASITVAIEGSILGTDWVELVAGVADPLKSLDVDAWPNMRIKMTITNGNYDSYLFDVFEKPNTPA